MPAAATIPALALGVAGFVVLTSLDSAAAAIG
jgi:hypothetical protein